MAIPSFTTVRQQFQRIVISGTIAIYLWLALAIPSASASSLSPVKGLIALKTMAQQSVPYDLAMANGKPTVLEFYADWCGSCQSMAPIVTELHDHYGDRMNFVMVNIDDAQSAAAVQQHSVTGIPHLLTLTANGEVIEQFVGRVPKQLLARSIESVVK